MLHARNSQSKPSQQFQKARSSKNKSGQKKLRNQWKKSNRQVMTVSVKQQRSWRKLLPIERRAAHIWRTFGQRERLLDWSAWEPVLHFINLAPEPILKKPSRN